MGISYQYFLLVRGGGLVVRSDSSVFIRVYPPCSSMCSTSLHEVHGWIFDEIAKFQGGIDVRRHPGRKYYSKTALRKWTRRPLPWRSSAALLVVQSRSVFAWLAFGPIRPSRSSVAPFGWSLLRWRRPFSIDISLYTFARTISRIWWMVLALRCPIAFYYWNLQYFGSIDGELRLSKSRNERNLSMHLRIEFKLIWYFFFNKMKN